MNAEPTATANSTTPATTPQPPDPAVNALKATVAAFWMAFDQIQRGTDHLPSHEGDADMTRAAIGELRRLARFLETKADEAEQALERETTKTATPAA